jgi:hypothetical protein
MTSLAPLPFCHRPTRLKVHQYIILELLSDFYTNVMLSLHDQLQHLSAAAHHILVIYSYDKGGSMPSQTYFDMMTTIKNVCVAKTQLDPKRFSARGFRLELGWLKAIKGS